MLLMILYYSDTARWAIEAHMLYAYADGDIIVGPPVDAIRYLRPVKFSMVFAGRRLASDICLKRLVIAASIRFKEYHLMSGAAVEPVYLVFIFVFPTRAMMSYRRILRFSVFEDYASLLDAAGYMASLLPLMMFTQQRFDIMYI